MKNINGSIMKPLGHENMRDFAKRIINGLNKGIYGESVVMDCGEGVLIVATTKSTVDSIINDFGKAFEDGYQDRYKKFESDLQRKRKSNE